MTSLCCRLLGHRIERVPDWKAEAAGVLIFMCSRRSCTVGGHRLIDPPTSINLLPKEGTK